MAAWYRKPATVSVTGAEFSQVTRTLECKMAALPPGITFIFLTKKRMRRKRRGSRRKKRRGRKERRAKVTCLS